MESPPIECGHYSRPNDPAGRSLFQPERQRHQPRRAHVLFLQLVQRYGDSTNGDAKSPIQQLTSGIPCPVGWLHPGSVAAPSGGGHWSLLVGRWPRYGLVDSDQSVGLIAWVDLTLPTRGARYPFIYAVTLLWSAS